MKMSKRMSVAYLVMLAFAGPASAAVITVPLSDFLIFAGGGWVSDASQGTGGANTNPEIDIRGASLYFGDVGSNWDFRVGASDTYILGSVYAGSSVTLAPNTAIGSNGTQGHIFLEEQLLASYTTVGGLPTFPSQLERVVANGQASIGNVGNNTTKIFGTLDAGSYGDDWTISGTTTIGGSADTFVRISMQGTSFVHAINTYSDQALAGGGSHTIDPGHWGDLTTASGTYTILLKSGDYYFDSIAADNMVTLKIDLSSGDPINIYVVGDATFSAQNNMLMVKGPGMTEYKLISDPSVRNLAGLINWETRETFSLGGGTGNTNYDGVTGWGSIWGGTVYSSLASGDGVMMDQHIDWYGALHAFDTIAVKDHSRYTYVSESNAVPEPGTLGLLGLGLVGFGFMRRKQ